MATNLKIIATPIGNIEDITLRAKKSLSQLDLLLAEDTRESLKLLQKLSVDCSNIKLLSCNSYNEDRRINTVIECLNSNKNVGLVSDAGAPTISDPGAKLIQAVIESGLEVEVIPGVSSVIAALMGAGLITSRFAFLGFLPKKGSKRQQLISTAFKSNFALVIFESALRIEETLLELHQLLGPAKVIIARELTKTYETFHRGVLGQSLHPPIVTKGEIIIIVEADQNNHHDDKKYDSSVSETIEDLYSIGKLSSKDIAGHIAKIYKINKQEAYKLVNNIKENKEDI